MNIDAHTPEPSIPESPARKGGFSGPAQASWLRRRRILKDKLARFGVGVGGIGVIVAIILIFFYLFWVVVPLFEGASATPVAIYGLPGGETSTLHLAMEEQAEVGVRFTSDGRAVFFDTTSGATREDTRLAIPAASRITAFSDNQHIQRVLGLGLSDGRVLPVRHNYQVSYPNDKRLITPAINYPFGEEPLTVDPQGRALLRLAFREGEEEASAVAYTEDGRLLLTHYAKELSGLDESEFELSSRTLELPAPPAPVTHIVLDGDQRELYVADADGFVSHYNVADKSQPILVQRQHVVPDGASIDSLRFLAEDISLLIGDSRGIVAQWFPVRDEHGNPRLTHIREFDLEGVSGVPAIGVEHGRKGFATVDQSGRVNIFHATAHRKILTSRVSEAALVGVGIGPRANAMLAEDAEGRLHFWRIRNEHPEISWQSLWGKVWYESYPRPEYIWQSSSASNDFEPKFSLVPISFGTLKAAFYAMLIAVPLSILGAMFTAHFMAPRMRQVVKPSIEIMEALPTVILGFLAGLWLAPFIEANLPGIFALLLILPLGITGSALLWSRMPESMRLAVPDGWESALLIVPVLLMAWLSLGLSSWMEAIFFGGDMRLWLTQEMGIGFDQRNSLVVGLAMGFAVIPTIFSITEDAIFGVPKHLTQGSLALGATPWQTMWRVVLLTASPGIFSAIMIGLGRAVGETMIVLMATGNTPVMDFSIFQGMRTLSANIAVEMPESEVDSTHYRVLFLAALVLFMFTFIFNTLAELIRQRLRRKYSSL